MKGWTLLCAATALLAGGLGVGLKSRPLGAEPPQEQPSITTPRGAFPPVVSDTEWHQDAWLSNDCLRCHETGVGEAPRVIHEGFPRILLSAKCRTCHVQIPGSQPRELPPAKPSPFAVGAFPPMIPASDSHRQAWRRDDCLLCHETGLFGAPGVLHEGLLPLLLKSKCRTCHVQVRVVEATRGRR